MFNKNGIRVKDFTISKQVNRPNMLTMTDAELNQILAALRLWQEYFINTPVSGHFTDEHFEETSPLSTEEIDELCERINIGPENAKPGKLRSFVGMLASLSLIIPGELDNPNNDPDEQIILINKIITHARAIIEGRE